MGSSIRLADLDNLENVPINSEGLMEKAVDEPSKPEEYGEAKITLESILEDINLGKWNYLIFLAACINLMVFPVILLTSPYVAPSLEFWCADPLPTNTTVAVKGDNCLVSAGEHGVLKSCEHFIYDDSVYKSSLTSQFNLVCERANLRVLYQLVLSIGAVFGAIFGGFISEQYGRSMVLWVCCLLQCAALALNIFSPVYWLILAARFVFGFTSLLATNVVFMLGMEVCPLRYRSFFGVNYAITYAIMLAIIGLTGWGIRDWQPLLAVLHIPSYLMVVLASPWVIDESPRWLISKARLADAERVLVRAGRLNGTTSRLPADLPAALQAIHAAEATHTDHSGVWYRVKSLFLHPEMRRITLLQGAIWLVQGVVYIFLPLKVDSFKSPYWSMLLLGLAEIPAYTVTAPVTDRLGRRMVLGGAFLLASLFAMLDVGITLLQFHGGWTQIIIVSVAYSFYATAWQIGQMHRAELFPTAVRSVASSISYGMAHLGHSIPPIIQGWVDENAEHLTWAPEVGYCALGVLGTVLIYLMPETNGVPLKQTVQELVDESTRAKMTNYVHNINKLHRQTGITLTSAKAKLTPGVNDDATCNCPKQPITVI